jgi:hypothetical protein
VRLLAVLLATVGLIAGCQKAPPPYVSHVEDTAIAPAPVAGPLAAALQSEIAAALQVTTWPQLDPPMESVISGPEDSPEVTYCGGVALRDPAECTWGSPTAPIKVVVAGDSVGLTYVGPLKAIAENSNGRVQVHSEAMAGCAFVNDVMANADQRLVDACPARKQQAVDYIKANKPNLVILAHTYGEKKVAGTDRTLTPVEWADSMRQFVDTFPGIKVALLAPPPANVTIADCYGNRSHTPADCISKVTDQWKAMADAEEKAATAMGGVWVDSRPWFCSQGQKPLCPSFVGTTATKHDAVHMAPAYGLKISPVIEESLTAAGVL